MTKYYALHPSSFKLDGGAMFGIIPKSLWEKKIAPDDKNRIEMSLRVLLIQTEKKNIIVDTGIGDYHGDKFNSMFAITESDAPLTKCLNEINLTPDDITDIIVTHLHFDHIGGLGIKSAPLFKKATLHLHKKHYEYSQKPSLRDTGSFHHKEFEPLIQFYKEKKQINWLEADEGTVIEGIKYKTTHGHTPFQVHPYDKKIFCMADILPTYGHIAGPWVMAYDMQPGISSCEKLELLKFCKDNQLFVLFDHDLEIICSKVVEVKNYEFTDPIKSDLSKAEVIF